MISCAAVFTRHCNIMHINIYGKIICIPAKLGGEKPNRLHLTLVFLKGYNQTLFRNFEAKFKRQVEPVELKLVPKNILFELKYIF